MNRISLMTISIIVFAFFSCSQGKSPEEQALEMVIKSNALSGDSSVDQKIKNWLSKEKDDIKPIGWKVSKSSTQEYLVSYLYKVYSFDQGSGERGYFFKVNLNDGSVVNITDDFERNLKPLSKPFKDEKEISEAFIKSIESSDETIP